jgi:hypothetical protein
MRLLALTAGIAALASAAAAAPDWSGLWNPLEVNVFDPSAKPDQQRRAGGIENFQPQASYDRDYPPYKPAYAARYEATLAKTRAGIGSDPTAACVPPGVPRVMAIPYPFEFVIQPNRVIMLFEGYSQRREVFTDGRGHPEDLDATYNGHSIGHWEGDTLVVETVGLRGDTVFDVTGAPHSEAMTVTERIRRRDATTLEDVITITDPEAMTAPWTVTRTYAHRPDWTLKEYVCEENQRNPVKADGTTGFVGADGTIK